MVVLPFLARALHHPGLAALLGCLLIGVGSYGLASGDIPRAWAAIVIAVGSLNVLRLIRQPQGRAPQMRNGQDRATGTSVR